jgi:hypothetical protein
MTRNFKVFVTRDLPGDAVALLWEHIRDVEVWPGPSA